MWKKLKIRYGLTDYQIALLRYLLFTFLSESSKLFFKMCIRDRCFTIASPSPVPPVDLERLLSTR